MTIYRLRISWVGSPVVGPGLSTHYTASVPTSSDVNAFFAFYTSLASITPTGVTFTVPDGGDTIDEGSGAITGTWGTGTSRTVTSANAVVYMEGVGARWKWATGGVVAGRHVSGTTYAVPMPAGAYDTTGLLSTTTQTTLLGYSSTLLTALAGNMTIWSRPHLARSGSNHAVVGASVPRAITWLRSRRT